MTIKIENHKEYITEQLKTGRPQNEVAEELNLSPTTLRRYLSKWNISHLKNQHRKGMPHPESVIDVNYYLRNDCPSVISSYKLKLKLIKFNLKKHQCEKCAGTEWQGTQIPLELDHIDGIKTNNVLSNLRLLCPNCHAQTDNYRFKNSKKYKAGLAKRSKAGDLKSPTIFTVLAGSNPAPVTI